VQAYGSKQLDASLLLIPLVGFLPANDPRVQGTLRAIENKLLINGEFVLRYEIDDCADGLPPGEGAFLACSYWLVANYCLHGRYADARRLFDRLLSRCNDVGLLAEEFDPSTGRMLGNFPQAYSHVGLIVCALNLSRETGPLEERAESRGHMAHVAPVQPLIEDQTEFPVSCLYRLLNLMTMWTRGRAFLRLQGNAWHPQGRARHRSGCGAPPLRFPLVTWAGSIGKNSASTIQPGIS
jgi:hypothetical protein